MLSCVQLFATPWTVAHQTPLSFTISWNLLKFMSTELVMLSSHLILCRPLSFCLQSLPASESFPMSQLCASAAQSTGVSVFQSQLSFNISPSNEHPGLISFRMDWLDLLAVQGTLKSLLQHHSWKASVLQHAAFFMVQLSHSYNY